MEEKLLKIFKLADLLYKNQNKVYAEIKYCANNRQMLEIALRSKEDFTYKGRCEVELTNNPLITWDNAIELFENYIGGITNE